MKSMSKIDAVREIIRQASSERLSYTKYKAARRALSVLLDTEGDVLCALAALAYLNDRTYEPYKWLADKIKASK